MMKSRSRNKPIYVLRLTPELSLLWTILGMLLLIMTGVAVSWFYEAIHGQSLTLNIESVPMSDWWGILTFAGLIAIVFGTTLIHELVHGIAFAGFGGSPRYGFKIKYLLPLAYATSPGDRFPRNAYVVIGLAPLVVIDVVCLILLAMFPQAGWLAWVIIFNTAGAIGDIWMVTQILRCPRSVQIEDCEESMLIYAPLNMSLHDLPFRRTDGRKPDSSNRNWLNFSLKILVLLVILGVLLIPMLKILEVPDFIIGTDAFWILRWQNNPAGFGLVINWLYLLLLLIGLFLLGVLVQKARK